MNSSGGVKRKFETKDSAAVAVGSDLFRNDAGVVYRRRAPLYNVFDAKLGRAVAMATEPYHCDQCQDTILCSLYQCKLHCAHAFHAPEGLDEQEPCEAAPKAKRPRLRLKLLRQRAEPAPAAESKTPFVLCSELGDDPDENSSHGDEADSAELAAEAAADEEAAYFVALVKHRANSVVAVVHQLEGVLCVKDFDNGADLKVLHCDPCVSWFERYSL